MATIGVNFALRHIHELFSVGTVASLPDAGLLDRFAQSRDETAFAALVDRHGPMVLAVCRAVLKDEHAAEDAFQAAFLVLAKKANGIRSSETLAAWLSRVAFRIALESRRQSERRRQREARVMSSARVTTGESEHDDILALHEELDRLPERLRVPVVLCHLEGKSYDEAARMLHVPSATIRGRLVRARDRLAARLTRRGITSAGAIVTATLVSHTAMASVPRSLAQETIRVAIKGSGSATVASLAAGYMGSVLATKAIVFGSLIAIAAGGLLAIGLTNRGRNVPDSLARVENPLWAAKAVELPAGIAKEQAAPVAREPKADDAVIVSGRVISPTGQPVSRAVVKTRFNTAGKHEPAETTTDPDGQFRLLVSKAARDMILREGRETKQHLVASASGFGASSAEIDLQVLGAITIKLRDAGSAIEGSVLDLEGRPVAGAKIETQRLWSSEGGNLEAWAKDLKEGRSRGVYQGLQVLIGDANTSTGKDGRFKLEGLGPEVVADLVVSGPGIATEQLVATNHPGPELRFVREGFRGTETTIIHPTGFQVATLPSKVVEGVVRDKDTGKPIANVNVQGAVYDPQSLIPNHNVSVLTDAEGRYKLAGLAKADAYRVFVYPNGARHYVRATLRAVADTPALEPVHFDISLKKGVLVKGRLLDKATGKPVPIERVNTCSFADNANLGEYPGYREGGDVYGEPDGEGGFEAVVLPGHGLLGVRAQSYAYLKPQGVEKIEGYDKRLQGFEHTIPMFMPIVNYHAIAETNFAPGTESATIDLIADPGQSVKLSILDPNGKPLGGTVVDGADGALGSWRRIENSASEVEVKSLSPSEPRRVTVRHMGRKLIGSVVLKGEEPGPVTLKLQPWAEVKGRVVDEDGQARPKLTLGQVNREGPSRPLTELDALPGSNIGGGVALDKDGRFHVVGLVPGLYYGADAEEKGNILIGHLFDDVKLAPSEVKDLGDLRVIKYKEGGNP